MSPRQRIQSDSRSCEKKKDRNCGAQFTLRRQILGKTLICAEIVAPLEKCGRKEGGGATWRRGAAPGGAKRRCRWTSQAPVIALRRTAPNRTAAASVEAAPTRGRNAKTPLPHFSTSSRDVAPAQHFESRSRQLIVRIF